MKQNCGNAISQIQTVGQSDQLIQQKIRGNDEDMYEELRDEKWSEKHIHQLQCMDLLSGEKTDYKKK